MANEKKNTEGNDPQFGAPPIDDLTKDADEHDNTPPANDMTKDLDKPTGSINPAPAAVATPTRETVQVVALHPIYYQPGQPPYLPGTALTVCVTTARNWLAGCLIRLAAGVTMPIVSNAGELAKFPVFPQNGTPAPASQG